MKNFIDITVSGQTQSGKTIITALIKAVLDKLDINYSVVGSEDFDLNKINDWEKKMVQESVVKISEINIPRFPKDE